MPGDALVLGALEPLDRPGGELGEAAGRVVVAVDGERVGVGRQPRHLVTEAEGEVAPARRARPCRGTRRSGSGSIGSGWVGRNWPRALVNVVDTTATPTSDGADDHRCTVGRARSAKSGRRSDAGAQALDGGADERQDGDRGPDREAVEGEDLERTAEERGAESGVVPPVPRRRQERDRRGERPCPRCQATDQGVGGDEQDRRPRDQPEDEAGVGVRRGSSSRLAWGIGTWVIGSLLLQSQ